jgi:hypothetical protein
LINFDFDILSTEIDFDAYQRCTPKASAYYGCVEDHFEQLETVWDERHQRALAFGGRMRWMLFIAIWIAGIYISALRVLNVKTVDTNICWPFLAKEGIFFRLAIRSEWWNSANGYEPKC